ncbi:hypothetical protein PanWU01x14_156110 [Parasponia andersonii]|uniref:Uncharacterized protein n=1 Tax=Parasponia andersonii TaxID=3476 RepID=A0A2P5CFS4_PARAD|nr:hypothetical protein PanWU01x14_156110 [Parasponia andersonii]
MRLREEAMTQAESQTQSKDQSMSSDQAGSAESVVGPLAIDHNTIMIQVHGHRSRCVKDVRSMLRLKAIGGQQTMSTGGVSIVQCQQAETIATLQRQLDERDAEHKR